MSVNLAALTFQQGKRIPNLCAVWMHQYEATILMHTALMQVCMLGQQSRLIEELCASWHVSASKLNRVHEEAAHVGPCVVVAWVGARVLGVLGGCAVERVVSLRIDGKISIAHPIAAAMNPNHHH